MSNEINNPHIIAITNGFYVFGDLIPLDESRPGFIYMNNAAMFGGFGGGRGMPAIARGEAGCNVILDRFPNDSIAMWPISSCCGIYKSVNLYKSAITKIR